jgi:hypothetical protein
VLSEGVKQVIVNGVVAVKDGMATGARGGRALMRANNSPSRPANADLRALTVKGSTAKHNIAIDVSQGAGVRVAKGSILVDGVLYDAGFLQTTQRWASITGAADGHALSVTVDPAPPNSVVVTLDGKEMFKGFLAGSILIR